MLRPRYAGGPRRVPVRLPARLLVALVLALAGARPLPGPALAQAPRTITLTAPAAGAAVTSPVEVQGRVTVAPFENTLVGTVVDAAGRTLGTGPVSVTPDDPGALGGPGAFSGEVGFSGAAGGAGRVVVADVSAADGSVLASAGVDVVLPGGPAGSPPAPPPGPPLGRVVGATYANPAAGYAHELPASWISHGYRWYESWVQQADQARPGAAYVAEWVYVPADPAKPEAALVTIAVYPAAVWASLAAQGGPPVGQALAATARWVYAWSGRQDAPYGDGSADDQQAAALYADAHVVVDTFRLLPAAGRPPAAPPWWGRPGPGPG